MGDMLKSQARKQCPNHCSKRISLQTNMQLQPELQAITELCLTLSQDITVQTQTGTKTRDEIKRLVLHHCSIAEAAWHLFVSVVQQPYAWWSRRQTGADMTWHFHSFHGPVDKQEFDRRLQPRVACKQPSTSTNEKLGGKLFGFSYWNC